MARGSKTKVPVTPTVRRFLHDVFKPGPSLLGKRARDASPPPPHHAHAHAHHPACVALQNEDHDEDAIIITALASVPFCCHADLLTMARTELLSVAHTLNAKLPRLLQIDVAPARSDAAIRCAIERLVGLGVGAGRGQVPPDAPRPARSMRSLEGDVLGRVLRSPASPLADRSTASVGRASLALAALREEDDVEDVEDVLEPVDAAARAGKKRRYNLDLRLNGPYFGTPPTRMLLRSQSHRVAPAQVGMAAKVQPARMLRAYSQRLPERRPLMQVPGARLNVDTTTTTVSATAATRGHAVSSHELLARAVASTPKKERAASALVSCASVSMTTSASASASASSVSTSVAGTVARGARGLKRKRKVSEDSGYAAEVTFGIDGMTMGFATSSSSSSSSRMDVSAD